MNRFLAKRINEYLLHFSYKHRLPVSFGLPNQIFIEPTNICNASCPLCPVGLHELSRQQGRMKMETLDRILQEMGGRLETIYFWNYGEPFLHRDLLPMISKVHRQGIRTIVSTNGTGLYVKENIQALLTSRLDVLIISLDGASPETFNQYRVGMDFDRVIHGLEFLVSEKSRLQLSSPDIEVQFLVMKQNYAEISKVRDLAVRLGIRLTLKSVNIEYVGLNSETGDAYLPDDETYSRYQKSASGYKPRFSREPVCFQLWHSMVINWDGTVVPCCKDYNSSIIIGNILTDSVYSIWNGKKMRRLRQAFLTSPDSIPLCADCVLTDFSLVKVDATENDKVISND